MKIDGTRLISSRKKSEESDNEENQVSDQKEMKEIKMEEHLDENEEQLMEDEE